MICLHSSISEVFAIDCSNAEFCASCVCVRTRACVCVCVCERERETGSHHSGVSYLNPDLCDNTYELHHCVCHTTLFLTRA